jgi:hypothetical protein
MPKTVINGNVRETEMLIELILYLADLALVLALAFVEATGR